MAQNLISEETVLREVRTAIAETLGADPESVRPESSLIRDLGNESLDLLDINYRLEQKFSLKMARHFILEHIENMFGEGAAIDEGGKLTGNAIALLKIRMGDQLPENVAEMDMDEVPQLITVQTLVRNVMDILGTLPEACTSCGAKAWKVEDETHVLCVACGDPAVYATGDELIDNFLKQVQEERNIF